MPRARRRQRSRQTRRYCCGNGWSLLRRDADVAPTLGRSKDSLHPTASASSCPAVLVAPLELPPVPVLLLGHLLGLCGNLGADGDAPSVSDVIGDFDRAPFTV